MTTTYCMFAPPLLDHLPACVCAATDNVEAALGVSRPLSTGRRCQRWAEVLRETLTRRAAAAAYLVGDAGDVLRRGASERARARCDDTRSSRRQRQVSGSSAASANAAVPGATAASTVWHFDDRAAVSFRCR